MDFTRKARFCAGGHTTDTLAAMTQCSNWVYASSAQWIGCGGL
jgi:hypothetical protein